MRPCSASTRAGAVWWPLGLSFAIAACGTTVPTNEGSLVVERGVIKHHDLPVLVDVPPEARSDVPAVVTVYTYGLIDCVRPGETRVSVDGLEALIEPFDTVIRPTGPNEVCALQLRRKTHEAHLVFAESGEATLTIRGVEEPSRKLIEVKRVLPVR